jgi:hypothetical protein
MARRQDIQDATGAVGRLPGYGTLEAWGAGAPAASAAGFAKGCLYHDVTNALLYLNTGTTTSATWSLLGNSGGTLSSLTVTTGTVTTLTSTTATITTLNPTNIVRASQRYQVGRGGSAKAGTTAGWTVNAGNNLGTIATVAQSQTGSTLVIGLTGLRVGDTITGFSVYSSINSAGNTVTLDGDLRKITIAAGAAGTDASVGTMTQVSVTAATASTATKTGLTEVVTAGVAYYLLLTATTGATTTIELSQVEVIVTTG